MVRHKRNAGWRAPVLGGGTSIGWGGRSGGQGKWVALVSPTIAQPAEHEAQGGGGGQGVGFACGRHHTLRQSVTTAQVGNGDKHEETGTRGGPEQLQKKANSTNTIVNADWSLTPPRVEI